MSTLFEMADDWLPGAVEDAAGVEVTYTRAGQTPLTFTAVVGQTRFASNQEGGARLIFGERDYLVRSELIAGLTDPDGRQPDGEPMEGDRITQTVRGAAMTFECATPETGEPAWRWSDADGQTVARIHCKRVA